LPEVFPKTEENKKLFITMELKSQAGKTTSGSYKKHLALFDEGTPQQWIDTHKDILEVWTQNSIDGPTDRMAIVTAVLRGESLTTFEAAITEAKMATDADGKVLPFSKEMVDEALAEVTTTIFPHRALECQKQWMRKNLKKPAELSVWTMAAALSRINSCLPFFPGATEASKFTPEEMVEVLECSLPYAWRQKFDLDGYIPTDGSRAQLIINCEAIERNEESPRKDKKEKDSKDQPNKKKVKFNKGGKPNKDSAKSFYCTEHGKNATHNTDNCYTLKNKKASGDKKTFSNKNFRKEINMLLHKKLCDKVLDQYLAVINKKRLSLRLKSLRTKILIPLTLSQTYRVVSQLLPMTVQPNVSYYGNKQDL